MKSKIVFISPFWRLERYKDGGRREVHQGKALLVRILSLGGIGYYMARGTHTRGKAKRLL
jgi:hypothetical protein